MYKLFFFFSFLFILSSAPNALSFYKDQSIIYLAYRRNQINSQSKVNPDIISLESYYSDLRYYLSWNSLLNENLSIYMKPKFKIYNPDEISQTSLTFDEGYLSCNPSSGLFIDIGKKNIRWGTAYAWNLVNNFEDGNRFIKEDNNFKDIWLFQYFLDEKTALSYSGFFNSSDYVLKFHASNNNRDYDIYLLNYGNPSIGFDFSSILNDALELHFESVTQQGSLRFYPTNPTGNIYTWEQTRNNDSLYAKFVLGGQYTTQDNLNYIFEFYHNPLGLSKEEFELLQNGINEAMLSEKYKSPSPWYEFMFDIHNNYEFAEFRQNYLFFRIQKDNIWGHINGELINYYSIDEGGFMSLPSLTYQATDNFTMNIKTFIPIGNNDSEFKRFYNLYLLFSINYFM